MPSQQPSPADESSLTVQLDRFDAAWREGAAPRIEDYLAQSPASEAAARRQFLVRLVMVDLEYRWRRAGSGSPRSMPETTAFEGRRLEDYVARYSDLLSIEDLPLELIAEEYRVRWMWGDKPSREVFQSRFAQHGDALRQRLEQVHRELDGSFAETRSVVGRSAGETSESPASAAVDAAGDPAEVQDVPPSVGRYCIEKILGQGGFGRVYLGRDEQLARPVAVKVPHARLVARAEDAQAYLTEARTVASLDHPQIVPVFDVGSTAECPCYIVSKFVDGTDLATLLKTRRFDHRTAAELVATVAEALHYAHKQGLVHRDIKPGNILLDRDGRPHVVDFGLALREENVGHGPRFAGTPAYMSPEQARGEGHRVDGRSDVFSLGAVLYELLVGRRPFLADMRRELLEQITSTEARPPRQIDDTVSKELERICLKMLSSRASDRYTTARDAAEDLRHFLIRLETGDQRQEQEAVLSSPLEPRASSLTPPRIVPKGLRAFDAHDADFFLELLPGPRDRDGLPDSIRFWTSRIEDTEPEQTFRVGLIYGPSGCGKSSLVKAGLLPRLAGHVIVVYVESTGEDTEARVLSGLRKACPTLPRDAALLDALTMLRRGQAVSDGCKVCLILDQFEQWLHAQGKGSAESELVAALRQCDGVHLQCVLTVRDDFWLGTSRLFQLLEIRLIEDHNVRLVDLFDLDHARKVLHLFGQAYGRLPDRLDRLTPEQSQFIDQVVRGLAQEDNVISVRLSLFADMLKARPWTPAGLQAVGGTEGVGVTFLEETFTARTANPEYRAQERPIRAVLQALLPESGSDIKGRMRSRDELAEACALSDSPQRLAGVLAMLDRELHLITPTERQSVDESTPGRDEPLRAYYQLTHDYLVPSIREWLTRKQKETRRGRAELRLAERAAMWNSKRENRFLPSLWEYLDIRVLTNTRQWTDRQRNMMSRAARFHGVRSALAVAALVALAWIGMLVRTDIARQQEATRIRGLVSELASADPARLPDIVQKLDANPQVAATFLSPLLARPAETLDARRARLHARLATVSRDPSLVEPLVEELLTGKVTYVIPIRQLLRPTAGVLAEKLRGLLRDEKADPQRRFRAALALADDVPESGSAAWRAQDLAFVAEQLVSSNAEFQPLVRDALRPVRERLLGDLERIFADATATDAQRVSAANALADYSPGDIARLSQLCAAATPEQFAVVYPLVAASPSADAIDDLGTLAATLPTEDLGSAARVSFGERRANAAVTLLRLGQRERVLPVFEMTDDPEALTQFIFRCRPRGVGVDALLELLSLVTRSVSEGSSGPSLADASGYEPALARYTLLLALGEFTLEEIPETRREALLTQLADWYRHDPSSGVHGAAGWLLRRWGQTETAEKIEQTQVPYSPDREWFTLAITVTPTPPPNPASESAPANDEAADRGSPPEASPDSKGAEPQKAEDSGNADSSRQTPPAIEPVAEASPSRQTFYYTFIVLPAGEYTIGSVADELDRPPQEEREQRHPVTLTRPFALLDREITFEELIAFSPQYAGFMEQLKAKPADAGFGPDWYDSVRFCRWLSGQRGLAESDQAYASPDALDTEQYPREPDPRAAPRDWPMDMDRRGFRLPTDAEWEVAARAGARTAYGHGGEAGLLDRFGWFADNSGKQVHPPRELRPGVRGLFDVHGNLFEWTHDWYDDHSEDAVIDPQGPQSGSDRVGRGGSWGGGATFCRAAYRRASAPSFRTGDVGFRLALSPSGVAPEASPDKESGAEPEAQLHMKEAGVVYTAWTPFAAATDLEVHRPIPALPPIR